MAKWIRKGTQILNHERFLKAGPHGRDLYDWGMLHTGFFEKDGFIPTIAVETSAYGHGSAKRNLALAEKLIEVGLWGRAEGGFVILRWVEQGNATAAKLEESREEWRAAKAARDAAKKQAKEAKSNTSKESPGGTPVGTPERVPYSPSYSSSSESRSREPDPARATSEDRPSRPHNDAPPCATPTSLVDLADGLVRSDLPLLDDARAKYDAYVSRRHLDTTVEDCWIGFVGHHAGQRFGGRDGILGKFQHWLTRQAKIDETARGRRRDEQERAEKRDATFAARFPPKSDVAPMTPYRLAADARDDEPTAEELAEVRRLAAKGVPFLDATKTGTDE